MGCKISKGDSRGDFFSLLRAFFYMPQVDPFLSLFFFYLPIEWQEITKRFRPVILGVGGVLPGKRLL